jgi:hypothetical protein
MIGKLEQEILSVIEENLDIILRLKGFIVVAVDQENPDDEQLICIDRQEFDGKFEDAYDILNAVKVRLFKKSYVVNMPKTKMMYYNLEGISKFIDKMDIPLDQISYGKPLQDGRTQVESMTIGWKNDPVNVLENIYGYSRDFVV